MIPSQGCSVSLSKLNCNTTEILLAYDGSEPADHARKVVFARFDPDVVTVLFVFDPEEAGYEAPDPFGTDTELTELATERAEEVFTSFEVPGESDTTVRTVHGVGHPAGPSLTTSSPGATAVRASRVSCSGASRRK